METRGWAMAPRARVQTTAHAEDGSPQKPQLAGFPCEQLCGTWKNDQAAFPPFAPAIDILDRAPETLMQTPLIKTLGTQKNPCLHLAGWTHSTQIRDLAADPKQDCKGVMKHENDKAFGPGTCRSHDISTR